MTINIKLATNQSSTRPPAHYVNNHFAVEANHLHIYYGNFRAVKDVNLKIETQKITAIIGPSGCGKSTTSIESHERFVSISRQKAKFYSLVDSSAIQLKCNRCFKAESFSRVDSRISLSGLTVWRKQIRMAMVEALKRVPMKSR
jgi:ABC-type histidine transport system ATPase subunit